MVRPGIRLQALPPRLGAKQEDRRSAASLSSRCRVDIGRDSKLFAEDRFATGPSEFLVYQPQFDELTNIEADLGLKLAVFQDFCSLKARWQPVDEQVLRLGGDLGVARRLRASLTQPFMDGLSVGEWLTPFFLAGDEAQR